VPAWHNFFRNVGMDEKVNTTQENEDRKSDDKCTAGKLPEKQEQFDDTSWVKNAHHGVSATEAERKNVSKTLPDTAAKEKDVK
jgi:hypothetical protein